MERFIWAQLGKVHSDHLKGGGQSQNFLFFAPMESPQISEMFVMLLEDPFQKILKVK